MSLPNRASYSDKSASVFAKKLRTTARISTWIKNSCIKDSTNLRIDLDQISIQHSGMKFMTSRSLITEHVWIKQIRLMIQLSIQYDNPKISKICDEIQAVCSLSFWILVNTDPRAKLIQMYFFAVRILICMNIFQQWTLLVNWKILLPILVTSKICKQHPIASHCHHYLRHNPSHSYQQNHHHHLPPWWMAYLGWLNDEHGLGEREAESKEPGSQDQEYKMTKKADTRIDRTTNSQPI